MSANQRMTERELWLRVALAVAGGMPTPRKFGFNATDGSHPYIVLQLFTGDAALRWIDHLGGQGSRILGPDRGGDDYSTGFDAKGWHWLLIWPGPETEPVEPDPAAAEALAAAITGEVSE